MASPAHVRALEQVRGRMRWRVEPGSFALAGFPEPPEPGDLDLLCGPGPVQLVREGGETTLLVPEVALAEVLQRHPSARVERELLWIRFELPMAWDLVGFLAWVTSHLARAEVPLGAVCGYSRDHLFVARRFEERTREALAELFPTSR